MPNLFNPELIKVARDQAARAAGRSSVLAQPKQAFVDPMMAGASDPAMAGGGGAPMDPAMGGGGADPMAGAMPPMPGMGAEDPMAAGGDPAAGGAPPVTMADVQAAIAASGGGAGAGAPGDAAIKPKIDVNVEIMQMKNMIAKLLDAQGIPMPAQEMVATPDKLEAMAGGEQGPGGPAGGSDPSSAIGPPSPIEPAMPAPGGEKAGQHNNGRAVPQLPGMSQLSNRASALATVLRQHASQN